MADPTALTAIVVSGVVGPGLGAWWTRNRQRDAQEQALAQELRDVLDEAAHALGETKRAFERLYVLQGKDCARTDPAVIAEFQSWRSTLGAVRYAEDRIAIRLGLEHPVHTAFVACKLNLEARRSFAWSYERGETMSVALAEQDAAHAAYPAARRAYIEACKALVGPHLGNS